MDFHFHIKGIQRQAVQSCMVSTAIIRDSDSGLRLFPLFCSYILGPWILFSSLPNGTKWLLELRLTCPYFRCEGRMRESNEDKF